MNDYDSTRLQRKHRRELEESYLKVEWYINRLAGYISSICKVPFEDLKQEGFIGVVRAHELYNPEMASFLTYAQYWIKMSMFSLAYKSAYIMEIPEEFHSIYSRYTKLVKSYGDSSEALSYAKAGKALGVTATRLKKVVETVKRLKRRCSIEYVGSKLISDIDIERDLDDRSIEIMALLEKCATKEEVYVIDHMLGLTREMPKTLSWVGNILGVTKERVRQIKNSGLDKLKVELERLGWNSDEFG